MRTIVHNTLHARLLVGASISLSFMASIASAYDFGCQYIWEEPSPDNDLKKCIMDLPRNNPGVLMPPIIPVLFFVLCSSPIQSYSYVAFMGAADPTPRDLVAGCCCDGEEWDDVDEIEKSRLYPRRHVCVIKMLCLVVVICSIIPIIITPIGFENIKEFWDSFHDRTETEIFKWAETEKALLQKGLSMPDGTYIPPLNKSTFDGFDDIIHTRRDKVKYIDELVQRHYKTVSTLAVYFGCIPLILLAFLLVFIVCNCQKIFPALFTFLYFIFVVAFCTLSCCSMLLGVISLLTCGEVELQNRQLPGVVQWYVVPWCEKNSFFPALKEKFAAAEGEKVIEGCTKLIQLCDDRPLPQLPDVPLGQLPKIPLDQIPQIPLDKLPNNKLPGQLPNGLISHLSEQHHRYFPQSLNDGLASFPKGMDLAEYMKQLKSLSVTEYLDLIKSMKPFNCSLTPSTIASECTEIQVLDEILNSTKLKDGFPWQIACTTPNCTIGSCSEDCVESIRPYGVQLREKVEFGKRISNAIRRVFIHSDCDTFITRAVKPMSQCHLLSKGSFLIGAGLGLGAILLWFGILLLFKGQKLFFPTPKKDPGCYH